MACISSYFVYTAFFIDWYLVLWYGLHELFVCLCSECYTYVCVFEKIGYLSYFRAIVFRSYLNRMHALPLSQEGKQKEWKTIQTIAKNNNFPKHMIQKLNWKIQQKATHTQPKDKTRKIWTTFTYHSPKIRKVTNLFKNTHIGIAFKAKTITQQLKQTTPQTQITKKAGYTR